jgi:pyruvate dehydrogenase E2 component (dihydrolipoamide acetyltransferase)/2-oxoisovalerate dehydrogenase E2 component (dihydrolipoyl transacylase)
MEFRLPELGEGVYEAELVAWLVKPGDAVKRGETLMEVLTDKASMEVPSPFAGTVAALQAQPGQQLKVGDVVLVYTPAGQTEPAAPTNNGAEEPVESPRVERVPAAVAARSVPMETGSAAVFPNSIKAAPSVRYMARKLGLDLARIHGTGPGGRVLIGDLAALVRSGGGTAADKAEHKEPHPEYGVAGSRIRFQGLRRKIADHMVRAHQIIPHYTYVDECEVTELVRLRAALRETYDGMGIKLTYVAFFVKAVARALKEVPVVNATLDEKAGEIVLHDHYHIGVAVSTPGGLIVPVVHDADRKDLTEVAQEIDRLSRAARTGKTRLEDLRGGTFTVTSVGNIGGLISTPVINHPEVAILGAGKVIKRPVFDAAGAIRPADLLYLSFSFDHRVVDGAVGAAFGNAVVRRLQNPALLLLPEKLQASGAR